MTTSPASRHARRQATTTASPPRASAGPIPDDPRVDRARAATTDAHTRSRLRREDHQATTRSKPRIASAAPHSSASWYTRARDDSHSSGDDSPTAAAKPPVIHGHQRAGTATPSARRARCSRRAAARQPTASPIAMLSTTRRPSKASVKRGEREAGERRDDAVVEVRLPVDDEALDAGDLRVDVEVAAGQGVRLGVVEVAGERTAREQLPRPAAGRQQDERDDRDRRADARRPAGIAVRARSRHER